jgi:hypothetical protein
MSEEENGYGKPPKKHQFKKGVSGNPTGRPKGKTSLTTDLQKILNKKITIQVNGENMRITKQQAFLQRLVNDALAGEAPAARLLVNLQKLLLEQPEPSGIPAGERNKQDKALLNSFATLIGPKWQNKLEGT